MIHFIPQEKLASFMWSLWADVIDELHTKTIVEALGLEEGKDDDLHS